MTAFGEHVRALRRASGLTQAALAERIDARLALVRKSFDVTYLSKIEQGRVGPPSPTVTRALATELGADVDELSWLAGDTPTGLGELLRESPGARAFWLVASRMRLSEADWGNLQARLERVRESR